MGSVVWLLEIAAVSFVGGVVGSISGLGGGIVIVPALTLFLHIPIEDAIGASIISVIAVSSGAGSVYVKDRITNIRIAMFLEIETASGALLGAIVLSSLVNPRGLSVLFITVCDRAKQNCPIFPGAEPIRWGFEEPADAPPEKQVTKSRSDSISSWYRGNDNRVMSPANSFAPVRQIFIPRGALK